MFDSLKKRKDFDNVFKKGKSARCSFVLIKFLPNNLAKNRVGIIVSQKVAKKAVRRNKIKRWLKAALLPNLPKNKSGFDIILMALPGLEKKEFHEIKKIIDELFSKSF